MALFSNHDIIKNLWNTTNGKTWKAFRGVHSIDALPKAIYSYPSFVLLNTHAHYLPGEHWKVIFLKEDRTAEVFDSLALTLNVFTLNWLNKFTRMWKTTSLPYQHPLSATCGAFVLYFILKRLNYDSLESFNKTFSSNPLHNERMILTFYNALK